MTFKPDLSDYRPDPHASRQWSDNADHDQLAQEEAYYYWALGNQVTTAIYGKGTSDPVRFLLAKAAEESAHAVVELIEIDLTTAQGVDAAKALQSRAIRYREMVEWLQEAINMGNDAKDRIEDDPLIGVNETLYDQGDINGRGTISD